MKGINNFRNKFHSLLSRSRVILEIVSLNSTFHTHLLLFERYMQYHGDQLNPI